MYYKEVGFPSSIELPSGKRSVEWSEHAIREAEYDINGKIRYIDNIILDSYRIFEVETDKDGQITKFAYRTRYNAKCDVIYVFMQKGNNLFIRTAWLNRRSDKHTTLNLSKYDTP